MSTARDYDAVERDPTARFGIEGFTPYRGRDLSGSLNVAVYRNLHEQRRTGRVRWSIRARQDSSGLVLGHADRLALAGVFVHIDVAAQQRIKAGEFRTVHAWVYGQLTFCPTDESPWYEHAERVIYRPHESPYFRYESSGEVFTTASRVRFDARGMWAAPRTGHVYSDGTVTP